MCVTSNLKPAWNTSAVSDFRCRLSNTIPGSSVLGIVSQTNSPIAASPATVDREWQLSWCHWLSHDLLCTHCSPLPLPHSSSLVTSARQDLRVIVLGYDQRFLLPRSQVAYLDNFCISSAFCTFYSVSRERSQHLRNFLSIIPVTSLYSRAILFSASSPAHVLYLLLKCNYLMTIF